MRRTAEPEELRPDEPFPLARRYRRQVLPIFCLFVVSLVVLTGLAVRQVTEDMHLASAASRAREIAAELDAKVPEAWRALLERHPSAAARAAVVDALGDAATERGIAQLKIYDAEGRTVFSTATAEIGTVERNGALRDSLDDGSNVLQRVTEPDGTPVHEFYIPLAGKDGRPAVVFEIYEPVGYLRSVLLRALPLPTLLPGLLLVVMLLVLGYLIRRAQAGIDLRSRRVRELGQRLESLVSASAVGAVRAAPEGSALPVRRVEVSLLYSDVRGFTAFAEAALPEAVAEFLNRVMLAQIECVTRHGGDVDKFIGDAVLARFEGARKEQRAVAAALAAGAAVEAGGLPRGVGIGVYTGTVISGPIGPPARRDYTVVGDAVNICARLCALAGRGEVVVDAATLERCDDEGPFGALESVQVKGRLQPIAVRRSRAAPPVPAP